MYCFRIRVNEPSVQVDAKVIGRNESVYYIGRVEGSLLIQNCGRRKWRKTCAVPVGIQTHKKG
jgi:hypothetical protein